MYKSTGNPECVLSLETNTYISRGGYEWEEYKEWLAAGNTPEPQYTLEEIRQNQVGKILQAFFNAPKEGLTTSFGLKVDCDRQDKDNFQTLLDSCDRKGLSGSTIRLYNNDFAEVTTAELQTIIHEIEDHGLGIYQRKWVKETAIEQAATESEIRAITWDSVE